MCPRGAISSQEAETAEQSPSPAHPPAWKSSEPWSAHIIQLPGNGSLPCSGQLLRLVMQEQMKNPNLPLSYSFPTFSLIAQYKSFEPSLNKIASQMTNNMKIGFITRNNERNHSLRYQEMVCVKGALQPE